MKKKMSILLSSVVATSAVVAGCGSKDEAKDGANKAEKKDQVLNLLESAEIPSMDTAKATDAVSFNAMVNVMEGLYRLGENDAAVPGVAESHEVSEDGTVYTFKLRQDAKWSNGEPVTANDFVYAWKRVVNPATAAEYAYIMYDVKNAEAINSGKAEADTLGVVAKDDYTLEVTLEKSVPYFDKLVTFPTFFPASEKFVTEQGDKYALESNTTLYNGPFEMTEWKHEQSFKFEKNADYWDNKTVSLETINFKIVKDPQTAVNLFEAGEVQRVALTSENVDKYKNDPRFGTEGDSSLFFFRLNQKNEVFANVNARKAISMAFDKQGITDTILNNGSKPADYFVPSEFVTGPDGKDFREGNGNMNEYNVEEAAKLWETAKKEIGKDKVEIELLTFDGEGAPKLIAQYVQEQLQKNLPGLTVTIKQQPFKQKLELESNGDYALSIAGWGPDYPDPMTFLDMFVTDGSHNQMSYSNKEYDALIETAKNELDLQARWDAMVKAEKILLADDAAITPLYQRGSSFVQDQSVKGLISHKFGGDFSYKWVSIE